MPLTDVLTLLLLAAFAAWGAWRGAFRQLLTVGVLAAAFPVAARLGPELAGTVQKVAGVSASDRALVGWAAAFVGVLVAGGVLLAVLRPLLVRVRLLGRLDRWVGGVLGLVQGAVLLSLVLYGILVAGQDARQPHGPPALESSLAHRGAHVVAEALRATVGLPPDVERAIASVEQGTRLD